MAKKYTPGMELGPYKILFVEEKEKTNTQRRGIFICPDCGQQFESQVCHIVSGAIKKCKQCRYKDTSGKNNGNFKNLLGKKFGKITVIEYLGSDTEKWFPERTFVESCQKRSVWKCKCDCGNIKIVTGNELTRKDGIKSCGRCGFNSNGEYILSKLFDKMNISYIRQKTFNTCKDINKLPFDFYLPDYNCCIEYDGISHYKPNLYGGWNTLESVKHTQYHDAIKNNYCKNNNIKLIRIPYTDLDKINSDYIISLLNEVM